MTDQMQQMVPMMMQPQEEAVPMKPAEAVADPWGDPAPEDEVPVLDPNDVFGTPEVPAEALSAAVQLQGDGVLVEETPAAGRQNMTRLTKGDFAMDESEEIAALGNAFITDGDIFMDDQGVMYTGDAGDPQQSGQNMTRLTKGDFAVQQWHVLNPALKQAEIQGMRLKYPQAKMKILSSGYMVWLITMKISKSGFCAPWTFMLRYEADHPNNHGYGGSIHVTLVKPTYEELLVRAKAAGRPGVPHLVHSTLSDGKEYVYLCTRSGGDIETGETRISSAVQVAGWAADWAGHYEVGLRDKKVWNKWCDDAAFRHLQIR